MSGALLAQARLDAQRFTEAGGFEDDIIITTKDGSLTKTVKGRASGIWLKYDEEGNVINTANNRVAIHENTLLAQAYPVRNADGQVALKDHKILVNDQTGTQRSFTVTEQFPNATTGLIMLQLGFYSV